MDIESQTTAMAEKMSRQLRVRGEGLAEVAEKAGRKLPRKLRKEADVLIQAEAMSGHPKMFHRIDSRRVNAAERRLNNFLDSRNPTAERWGEFLDIVAKIAFVLLTIVLIAFFVLVSRGYFD